MAGKQLFHKYKQHHLGYQVCQEGYMAYHGISTYQFYTALWHVDEGSIPDTMHGNQLYDHSSIKKDLYTVWLSRICTKLVEGLLTGFKLELSKRVSKNDKLLFINPRWQKMIFLFLIDIIQISCLMQIFIQDHMEEIETPFSPKNSYQ
jgi:hypothetical protein